MFSQAPRCAFLLALAASLAEDRAQGFHVAPPVVSVGCAALRRGAACTAKPLPPQAAVRRCNCGVCVGAAAGKWREALGGRARNRRSTTIGVGIEAGGASGETVPEFDLTDGAVEVGMRDVGSCWCSLR